MRSFNGGVDDQMRLRSVGTTPFYFRDVATWTNPCHELLKRMVVSTGNHQIQRQVLSLQVVTLSNFPTGRALQHEDDRASMLEDRDRDQEREERRLESIFLRYRQTSIAQQNPASDFAGMRTAYSSSTSTVSHKLTVTP